MRKRYNVYLGEKTIESLQKIAKRDDTTVSELIRAAIKNTYAPTYGHTANRPPVPGSEPGQPQSG